MMNSFQSDHGMGSHTFWKKFSHLIAVQKKGYTNYLVGNLSQSDEAHQ